MKKKNERERKKETYVSMCTSLEKGSQWNENERRRRRLKNCPSTLLVKQPDSEWMWTQQACTLVDRFFVSAMVPVLWCSRFVLFSRVEWHFFLSSDALFFTFIGSRNWTTRMRLRVTSASTTREEKLKGCNICDRLESKAKKQTLNIQLYDNET